jgi:mannose-1-phosphate guanylyltransferase/phosphomannomutase
MKTVIMAGGKGTRLRPLTSNQPKPMIPIVNVPCMEHIVNLLKRQGFEDILVTLEYMPDAIRGYFGDGSEWDVKMEYSVEEEPLGTAGSVKFAEDSLTERFVIVSGDALTDVDLTKAIAFHEEREAEVTLVLKKVSYTANTGIYVLEPEVLQDIPEGQEYDFSEELFPKLLDEEHPVYGYVMEGYWEDIGNIEQYMSAQRDVLDGKVQGLRPLGEEIREGVYVDQGVETNKDQLEGPVALGAGVEIAPDARVGPYSVLARNVSVGARASVVRSIVAEGSSIGESAELEGTLVGRACTIEARARILEGSTLGDEVDVGEGASIVSGVTIYPEESVESGAEVTEDPS